MTATANTNNSASYSNNGSGSANSNQRVEPAWVKNYKKYAEVVKEIKEKMPTARFDSEIYLLDVEHDLVVFRGIVLDESGAIISRQSACGSLSVKGGLEKTESRAMRRAIMVALGYTEGEEEDTHVGGSSNSEGRQGRGSSNNTSSNSKEADIRPTTSNKADTKKTVVKEEEPVTPTVKEQPVTSKPARPAQTTGVAITGGTTVITSPSRDQQGELELAAFEVIGRKGREQGSATPDGLYAIGEEAFRTRLSELTGGMGTSEIAAAMGYPSINEMLAGTKEVLAAEGLELIHYAHGQKLALALEIIGEWISFKSFSTTAKEKVG